jgi:tetratricopeptide (TPR) repeat protein
MKRNNTLPESLKISTGPRTLQAKTVGAKADATPVKRKQGNQTESIQKVNALKRLSIDRSPLRANSASRKSPIDANHINSPMQKLVPTFGKGASPLRQVSSPTYAPEEHHYVSVATIRELLNQNTIADTNMKTNNLYMLPIKKPAQPGSDEFRNISPEKERMNNLTAGPNSVQTRSQNLSINLANINAANSNAPTTPSNNPHYKAREETDLYVREMQQIETLNKHSSRKKSGRGTRPKSATPTHPVVNPPVQPAPVKSVSATVAKTVQAHNEVRKSIFRMEEEEEEPSYAELEHQKFLMMKEMKEHQSQMTPRSAMKFQEEYELSQVDTEVDKGFEYDEYGNIEFSFNNNDKKPEALCQEPLKLQYDPSQIQMSPVTNGTITGSLNTTYSTPSTAITMSSLKDFKHMARACNRAGKNRMEGLTHYKLGCKYEELNDAQRAIKHYKRFFAIAQELGDGVGTSLALNCLGVCYHRRKGMDNLKVALDYHMKHWEMADVQGKIVAHINMGLVYQKLGQIEQATENYKQAFQSALDLGDKHGESIALANLGLIGKEQDDLTTAQACIERHLMIAESMKDGRSASDAYQQLGLLANLKGETEQALKMLTKAREVALYNTDHLKANQLRCNIGIVSASLQLDKYMKDIAFKICESIKDAPITTQ